MPYDKVKGGGTCKADEWAVIKKSDGKTMGCHPSESAAQDQIDAIYANEGSKMTIDTFYHLGRLVAITEARQAELIEILKKSVDPGLADSSENLFYFRAEISNNLLDSHYTRMSEKTLQNYAEDASRGVAFLSGHDWRSLPIGYSITGQLADVGGKKAVVADFYTVSGIQETDNLIKRIKTGLLRDVSVGFSKGRMICDICSRDFWDCEHIPGLNYQTKNGDTVTEVLSTFTIDDSRLNEVSGVFDGSTPDAMITKATRMASQGLLSNSQVEVLQNKFRMNLPTKSTFVMNANRSLYVTNGGRKMEEKDFGRVIDVLVKAKVASEVDANAADEEQLTEYIEKLGERVQSLESQAEEGRQYRKDLIAEALAEGVRAQGNDFDADTYKTVLESASLTVVKRMRDDWKKAANAITPAGRKSVDSTAETKKKTVQLVPDEAYGG